MTTTFPQATLTKTNFFLSPGIFNRPDRSLLSKRALVDCKKGKESVTVAFYEHYGYHCSIWITDSNYILTGHSGKGSTILKALVATLDEIGITFESPIPESLTTHFQIEGVMHSIADALEIEHPRVITHAWR